jgi:hypothetical protein
MFTTRIARRTFCLGALLAIAWSTPAGAQIDPYSPAIGAHVRGATPQVNKLIARGIKESRTFASLVEQLNTSNVIVYIEITKDLPVGLDGRLGFMTAAGPLRYLHAQVRESLPLHLIIATAAHELQHAVEVAMHAEVRDAQSLEMLYRRIGDVGEGVGRYDTPAARVTGRRVRQELG